MRLVLFEPDIPQNAGALLRLAACLGLPVDIVEPCGFLFDDRRFRRAGMDYLEQVDMTRHTSWRAYCQARAELTQAEATSAGRLILLTTKGDTRYTDFSFQPSDSLMVGRESVGAPAEVHNSADARLVIPLRAELRSINVALAAAMVLSEALRQTDLLPGAHLPGTHLPGTTP